MCRFRGRCSTYEPRSVDFVTGTALCEPRSADFVAGTALGERQPSPFTHLFCPPALCLQGDCYAPTSPADPHAEQAKSKQ